MGLVSHHDLEDRVMGDAMGDAKGNVLIRPTVGRMVWFHPKDADGLLLAAVVTAVWGDRCVNLAVFERDGVPMSHPPTSVRLVQPGDPVPAGCCYCTWMPYQIQTAAAQKAAV